MNSAMSTHAMSTAIAVRPRVTSTMRKRSERRHRAETLSGQERQSRHLPVARSGVATDPVCAAIMIASHDRAGPVAHAADRRDDPGVVGVDFDLGTKALHVDVHEARVGLVVIAPDLLE